MPEHEPPPLREGDLLAAVDLGSNSFHLVVARFEHGGLRQIDRLREGVRLAMDLRPDRSLEPSRRQAALAALARFGQRLRTVPPGRVRAVATNTVRRLPNPMAFLLPAETALGHPIEVISGREEARLIHLGVAHATTGLVQRRLVVDIGGGSTELIIGQAFDALETESVQVGCVATSGAFFADGRYTPARWEQALRAVSLELHPFAAAYLARGWGEAIGSSGTARSIDAILQANGWSEGGITPHGLEQLRQAILAAGRLESLRLPGLSAERTPILAGGTVIMQAIFRLLELERMTVVDSALREGLLYDLVGRALHGDPRSGSIAALASRYGVDRAQAARVRHAARILFEQVAADWRLDAMSADFLGWAADLHEVGLAIAHSQHQVHGAYILAHSDLPGFGRQAQQALATLVRLHRRRPDPALMQALPGRLHVPVRRLVVLLRLAALLQRARCSEPLPELALAVAGRSLVLELPATWLAEHPLTRADLEQERDALKTLGFKLVVRPRTRVAA